MATLITSGVDYARFFDDIRAVIRHELQQANVAAPATPASEAEELLTVKQAAALLDVTVHSIHSWKQAGKLPYLKMGSRTYFKRAEVLSSLQSQQRTVKKGGRTRG